MTPALHTELWTSWASLLRSYCAAHGMSSTQHAVVEVSTEEIILRAGPRWMRFTANEITSDRAMPIVFAFEEDGTVRLGEAPEEEMDMAAERFAREMMAQ